MTTIEIKKISIVDVGTDAIVNAANEGLKAGGGVCGAIFKAAGMTALQKACDQIGGCPAGEAVITPAFNLNAKYIIHAVGPRWSGGGNGEQKLLRRVFHKSLNLARDSGCRSIGFPLISTGIFGYPVDLAWKEALSTCLYFKMKNPDADMRIVFAIRDDDVLHKGQQLLQLVESKKADKKEESPAAAVSDKLSSAREDAVFFHEQAMSAFLKEKFNSGQFPEASRALDFATEKHEGQLRKPKELKIPYINHPLTLACHALAMGLEEDGLLAALLLHDVCEDCGVAPEELPVSPEVQQVVALVTKPKHGLNEKLYYSEIAKNPRAAMVKCLDRCNNLSGMAAAFSLEKLQDYIEETERYYPELLRVIREQPEYNNAAWLLKYQIRSLLLTAKRITV